MALTRGAYQSFDYDRMVVRFSMMSAQAEIACAVSTSAMDDLEQSTRTKPEQREQQFMRLRDRIEDGANRKFEKSEFEGTPRGIILRSIDFH
jgi:Protein of unknown function (DUF1488)